MQKKLIITVGFLSVLQLACGNDLTTGKTSSRPKAGESADVASSTDQKADPSFSLNGGGCCMGRWKGMRRQRQEVPVLLPVVPNAPPLKEPQIPSQPYRPMMANPTYDQQALVVNPSEYYRPRMMTPRRYRRMMNQQLGQGQVAVQEVVVGQGAPAPGYAVPQKGGYVNPAYQGGVIPRYSMRHSMGSLFSRIGNWFQRLRNWIFGTYGGPAISGIGPVIGVSQPGPLPGPVPVPRPLMAGRVSTAAAAAKLEDAPTVPRPRPPGPPKIAGADAALPVPAELAVPARPLRVPPRRVRFALPSQRVRVYKVDSVAEIVPRVPPATGYQIKNYVSDHSPVIAGGRYGIWNVGMPAKVSPAYANVRKGILKNPDALDALTAQAIDLETPAEYQARLGVIAGRIDQYFKENSELEFMALQESPVVAADRRFFAAQLKAKGLVGTVGAGGNLIVTKAGGAAVRKVAKDQAAQILADALEAAEAALAANHLAPLPAKHNNLGKRLQIVKIGEDFIVNIHGLHELGEEGHAAVIASIVTGLRNLDPAAKVLVGGDFNAEVPIIAEKLKVPAGNHYSSSDTLDRHGPRSIDGVLVFLPLP